MINPFRKKFKVRVYASEIGNNIYYYVQYAYYRFFPRWRDIPYLWGGTKHRIFSEYPNAEKYAENFTSIEKVRKQEDSISRELNTMKTKIIIDK